MRDSSTDRDGSTRAVIEVDPVHVVVSETYADSEIDVVHATLDSPVSVKLLGSDALAHLVTDSVVMVATGDVVLVALSVDNARQPEPARSSADSLELIARAGKAVSAAANALLHARGADSA